MIETCQVCKEQPSKYKCPSCRLPYCCLTCYKKHKSTHTQVEAPGSSTADFQFRGMPPSTEATRTASQLPNQHPDCPPVPVSSATLSPQSITPPSPSSYNLLLNHPSLPALFRKYPQLRSQLKIIYTSTLEPANPPDSPPLSPPTTHRKPGRGRGRGRGRDRGQASRAPWTPERALKVAMRKMRAMRDVEGERGRGLREFAELARTIYGKEQEALEENAVG